MSPYLLVATYGEDCTDEKLTVGVALLADSSCVSAPAGSTSYKATIKNGAVTFDTYTQADCAGTANSQSFSKDQFGTCVKGSYNAIKVSLLNAPTTTSSSLKQVPSWLWVALLMFVW